MHFDWNISIGNVLTAAGLFIGFYSAHIQNIRRLEKIEVQLNLMYTWFVRKIVNKQRSLSDDE